MEEFEMNETTMTVDTSLDFYTSLAITDNIVLEYFNDNGVYQPHYGISNVVRLFYNYCVKSSQWEETVPHDTTDPDDIIPMMKDAEFMEEFNKAIATPAAYGLDFANAYHYAMDIVNTKKASFDNALEKLRIMCDDILTQITPMMSQGNLDKLSDMVGKFGQGGLDVESIIDAYANSQAFVDAITGEGKSTKDSGNMIPFEKTE
ncbi:MAG: hypothetical protein LUC91_00740 [Prevotella sp.]|nr:hypothetical protein [Prevotella sp.]